MTVKLRNVEIITATSTLRGLAYSSIWVYSSIYLHVSLHLSLVYVGAIFAIGGAISGLVQIYDGIVSDRIGYKVTVILSLGIVSLIYLLATAAPELLLSSLEFPGILIALMFGNSLQAPAANAIVSLSSDFKLKGFSMLRVGSNIGWGLGPAIGGFVLSYYSFSSLFTIGLAMSLISLILSFLISEPAKTLAAIRKLGTENRFVILLSIIALLLFIVQSQETVTLSNYARIIRGLPYYELGIVYLTNGIFVVVSQPFIFRISRKIGNFISYGLGTLIYSAGFFSYAFDHGIVSFVVSTVILTIGEDFAFPTGVTMISNVSKPENIGKNMGLYNAFLSAGRAVGPLLGGTVYSLTTDPVFLWFYTTLSGFASLAIFLGIFTKNRAALDQR